MLQAAVNAAKLEQQQANEVKRMSNPDPYTQQAPAPVVVPTKRKPLLAPRTPRSIVMIAVVGLIASAVGAVFALAWDVVIRGGDTAALVSISSIAVGALATIGGGVATRSNGSDRPPNQ